MPLILPGNVASATAPTTFSVANSCRFNDGDSAWMAKTAGSSGDRQKFTLSFWVKRGAMGANKNLIGECFNFGPPEDQVYSVEDLVGEISKNWPNASWCVEESENNKNNEANLLQLNCEKAFRELSWKANLDFKQTSKWTAEWYHAYYKESPSNAFEATLNQIYKYMELSEGNS